MARESEAVGDGWWRGTAEANADFAERKDVCIAGKEDVRHREQPDFRRLLISTDVSMSPYTTQ